MYVYGSFELIEKCLNNINYYNIIKIKILALFWHNFLRPQWFIIYNQPGKKIDSIFLFLNIYIVG